MARLMVTSLMALSVFITACQQQKFGSEPATAQPKSTPPPSGVPPRTPPPGNGGAPPPGVGPQAPPPGIGPQPPPPGIGAGGPPPPPPPGIGNGNGGPPPPPPPGNGPPPPPPGNGAQPPPGNGNGGQPPPGNGNGPTIIPTGPPPGNGNGGQPPPGNGNGGQPPPGNGNGGIPPSTGNGPGGTSPGPTVVVQPPTTTVPPVSTLPPVNTNTPPTVVNQPPQQQPVPPVEQLPPVATVPASNLPPQNYPQSPKPCIGVGCPNQQVVPPPAPVVPIGQQPSTPPPARPGPAQPGPVAPAPGKPTAPFEEPMKPTPIVVQPAPTPECEDQALDTKLDTTKLDLLFVFDTSASMRNGKRSGMTGELGMIAKQIGSFIKGLDESTDFRIGMMLGHGPENAKHPGYKHGTLFQVSSSDPAVIDFSKELKACGKGAAARKCAIDRVTAALERKIHSIPTDHSDAQGEAINLSLYNMATNEELRRGIKEQGLLRSGAMLNIIPISDEQDVCYSDVDEKTGMYSECKQGASESEEAYKKRCTPAQVKIKDAKGKVTGMGPDPHELNFYHDYCKRAVNNTDPLTIEHVYTALGNLKEGDLSKLAITPIIYLDNNQPVAEQDENEMGHGHLELADKFGGLYANLATARNANGQSDFNKILGNLGTYVKTKMTFATPFMCTSHMDPMAMDLNALDIHIIDQNGRDLQIFRPQCTQEPCVSPGVAVIGMDGHGDKRHVIIKVDENAMGDALKARGFKDGKARIKFSQRSDFNADGTRKNIFGVSARRSAKLKKNQPAETTQHADLQQNEKQQSDFPNMPEDI